MTDPNSLKLVCPIDRTPLASADGDLIAQLNRAIAAGVIKNRTGRIVEGGFEGGLVRADGTVLYPILDGIPLLLADEGIPLAQLCEGEKK
jgi:uncharacterized protein YbaR (Trm112 family)